MVVPHQQIDEASYAAETFNSTLAAAALSAAWRLGVLDELAGGQSEQISALSARHGVRLEVLHTILAALSSRRIVTLDADTDVTRAGPGFAEAYRSRGFFHWLIQGCGELLTTWPEIAAAERSDLRRDAGAISIACRNIARLFFDPPFQELIAHRKPALVADLGCGSADRIITLAQQQDQIHAIGIDIAPGAIAVATEAVATAELTDRITLICDDVLNLTPRPEYADVELVTCFMMGHDFWPRDRCVRVLRGIRHTFPKAESLVLGDMCRSVGLTGADYPMFTLGFEIVHAVMNQYVPTLSEWNAVFGDGGWRLIDHRMIDMPPSSFVYHLAPG